MRPLTFAAVVMFGAAQAQAAAWSYGQIVELQTNISNLQATCLETRTTCGNWYYAVAMPGGPNWTPAEIAEFNLAATCASAYFDLCLSKCGAAAEKAHTALLLKTMYYDGAADLAANEANGLYIGYYASSATAYYQMAMDAVGRCLTLYVANNP